LGRTASIWLLLLGMAGPGLAHAGLFDEIIGGPDVEKEFVERT
jgi:hypothetical protein